jgi:hypothetical protein
MRVSLVITVPRVLTWSCVILLAVLSLSPGQALAALSLLPAMKLVRTIIPAPLEHFVAYAGVAAIAVVAYSPSRVGVRIIGSVARQVCRFGAWSALRWARSRPLLWRRESDQPG